MKRLLKGLIYLYSFQWLLRKNRPSAIRKLIAGYWILMSPIWLLAVFAFSDKILPSPGSQTFFLFASVIFAFVLVVWSSSIFLDRDSRMLRLLLAVGAFLSCLTVILSVSGTSPLYLAGASTLSLFTAAGAHELTLPLNRC